MQKEEGEEPEIEQMKRRIRFHFMNPFEKWAYDGRRRFPWKLLLQLLNVALVISQVGGFKSHASVCMTFQQSLASSLYLYNIRMHWCRI